MEHLPDFRVAEVERRIDARLRQAANELRALFLQSKAARDVRVDKVHLPWRRLFEVGFDVKVEPGH